MNASAVTATGLRFGVLGPLEASRDGVAIDLGTRKQRAVLALLLLNANRVVPTERLIDDLWGDAAPETARSALQVYVGGLRRALGGGGAVLATRSPGYVLFVDDGALDLDRFDTLCERARAADAVAERSTLLREALSLWRGAPLVEFDGEPFAANAKLQLEERRLEALLDRIDADLALGRHTRLVAELEALVAQHPYSERLRGQQMLALYRSGRQADALAAYRAAREASVEDLGLEPGPELKELERAVLDHDPRLEGPGPADDGAGRDAAARPRRWTTQRRLSRSVLALGGLALLLVAFAAWLAARPSPGLSGVDPNHVGLIDADTGKIVEQLELGVRPSALAAAGGTLWAASYEGQSVTRIDEETGERTTIAVPGHPTALAADAEGVWVAATLEGRLIRIERAFDHVGTTRPVEASSIARAGGSLWVTRGQTTLQRLDQAGLPAGPEVVLDNGAGNLAALGETLWVQGQWGLTPVDARTGIAGTFVRLLGGPVSVTAGAGAVWAIVRRISGGPVVQKVDPDARAPAGYSEAVGNDPGGIAIAGDQVWVANRSDGTVSRLVADTLAPKSVVRIGATPAALVTGDRGVWVAAA
jgi:DNA-binding SARP family transcriptional activator/DNA-binding beta-propeller fold protein YncE